MNSDRIYVFDPIATVASHPPNSERLVYVPAPHAPSTGPPVQLLQGTVLPPATSTPQDSVPSGGPHVMSVRAYPLPYAIVSSPSQTYDVNHFDMQRYASLGTAISTGTPNFARPFTSHGQSPRQKAMPVYLVGTLGQEHTPTQNLVDSSFTPGYAYLESSYMRTSGRPPEHTGGATTSNAAQSNYMTNVDQGCLTIVPVSAPVQPPIPLANPWTLPRTSLSMPCEPVSSQALGLCESMSSSSLLYPSGAQRPSTNSPASVAQLNSPALRDTQAKSPLEYQMNHFSFAPKNSKHLSRFMGVRGFLAPPPLGMRIVPGTRTLIDIPPLAMPEPTWGILPQAALLAD